MAGDHRYVRMTDTPTTEDFLSIYCVLYPALGPAGREKRIKGLEGVLALKGLLASGQDLAPTLLCCCTQVPSVVVSHVLSARPWAGHSPLSGSVSPSVN